MRQHLHLLIVDRVKRSALAARFGTCWLLPIISCGEMTRAGPVAARWCSDRGLDVDVAGQWLGRVDARAIDWLMVLTTCAERASAGTLQWTGIDALANGRSVLDYQSWAIARCSRHQSLPRVDGPFGTLDWPERVRAWLAHTLQVRPLSCIAYRTSGYEVVLGIDTPGLRVFFKGLSAGRISEVVINERLAGAEPGSFARTLALERREDDAVWWVTAECPGRPAADPAVAAAALSRLQCRLQAAALAAPELSRLDAVHGQFPEVPASWMPMDLDGSNILIDGKHVTFIDVDDSFLGPAALAMAGYARRCGSGAAAYRAYERAWSPPLTALDWPRLESVALAVQTSLGWARVLRNIERGELHADVDLLRARIHALSARADHRR